MLAKIALESEQFSVYVDAIRNSGGEVALLNSDVRALIWTDYSDPEGLKQVLDQNPQLVWVQLPFAGVDAFAHLLDYSVIFTSAKRAYAEPVAEHALALALALGRAIPERVQTKSWGRKFAASLYDENILIIGGGGIAEKLTNLLEPFRAKVTVLRNRTGKPFQGNAIISGISDFESHLPQAKFIFITCALTNKTRYLFNEKAFLKMRSDSYLINVARGEIIDQTALRNALERKLIAGAAIDVTYPEPLPDGHELWNVPNLLITPHTADTPELVTQLFAERISVNVGAWIKGKPLIGKVDPILGY